MKISAGQIYPLALLGALAALTFWLQATVEGASSTVERVVRHEPDARGRNIEILRFDETGFLKYRLSAPSMVHFPDDDSSELESPHLIAYRPDAPQVTLQADHSRVSSQGETAFLWDNVVITRAATTDRPEMIARMPYLTVQPELGYAFTDSPVEMTMGTSWATGVGARLDQKASTFELQSKVRAFYARPSRATP